MTKQEAYNKALHESHAAYTAVNGAKAMIVQVAMVIAKKFPRLAPELTKAVQQLQQAQTRFANAQQEVLKTKTALDMKD